MSDAGETLLTMFDQVREASSQCARIVDLTFGLGVSEAVACSSCQTVTHRNAYTQYFYNTRVSGWSGAEGSASRWQVPAGRPNGLSGHTAQHVALCGFLLAHVRLPPRPPACASLQARALRRIVAATVEERRRGILASKTLGGRLRKIEEQVHKSCDTDHGEQAAATAAPAKLLPGWGVGPGSGGRAVCEQHRPAC